MLRSHIEEARSGFVLEPEPHNVFLEHTGEVIGADRLSRLVTKYIKDSDVGKPGSCHLFRHTVATLMMDNGADIRLIQQMLGHASILTTEVYTHVSLVKLKEIHEVTHPTLVKKRRRSSEPDPTKGELLDILAEEEVTDA